MSNSDNFCCPDMKTAVEDSTMPLVFNERFREFGIRILDGGTSYLLIQYCPWCGTRLASSLRDVWFDRLNELGIEPDGVDVPRDMLTDAWWKKEGL